MNDDATMNELAGKYEGMDRFAARKAIVKDLEEAGLLVKNRKHLPLRAEAAHEKRRNPGLFPEVTVMMNCIKHPN